MQLNPAPQPLRRLVEDVEARLPEAEGKPIRVHIRPNLHSHRGKLHSETAGEPVHAACDIQKRLMFLDESLESQAGEFRRILIHEIFHFAWARVGNEARGSFAELLVREFGRNARGELGWSAEYRKDELRQLKPSARNRKRWSDYVCESFCDTAAWVYSGLRTHPEFTLSQRHRGARARWFSEYFSDRKLFI